MGHGVLWGTLRACWCVLCPLSLPAWPTKLRCGGGKLLCTLALHGAATSPARPPACAAPQEATHFKKVRGERGEVLYEPCSPGDPAAEPYTLQKLDEEGKAGMVSAGCDSPPCSSAALSCAPETRACVTKAN